MEYRDMSDEVLYRELILAVPNTILHEVNHFNRNTVIAMLKVIEEMTMERARDRLEYL